MENAVSIYGGIELLLLVVQITLGRFVHLRRVILTSSGITIKRR